MSQVRLTPQRAAPRPAPGESPSLRLYDEAAGKLQARLVVVEGNATVPAVRLRLPATIGRGIAATIVVGDRRVSRAHCEIVERDAALVVRDLGSLNGTQVNGRPIGEARLAAGDRLTVGPLTFRVEYQRAAAPAPAAPGPAPGAPSSAPASRRKALGDDEIDMILKIDD
jgi:hypothetical protein